MRQRERVVVRVAYVVRGTAVAEISVYDRLDTVVSDAAAEFG